MVIKSSSSASTYKNKTYDSFYVLMTKYQTKPIKRTFGFLLGCLQQKIDTQHTQYSFLFRGGDTATEAATLTISASLIFKCSPTYLQGNNWSHISRVIEMKRMLLLTLPQPPPSPHPPSEIIINFGNLLIISMDFQSTQNNFHTPTLHLIYVIM